MERDRELEREALEEAYRQGFLVYYRLPWEEEEFPYEEWEEEVSQFFFWQNREEEKEEEEEREEEWLDEHWLRRV